MKRITPIQGTSIIRFSPDEVAPEGGYLVRDLLQLIGDMYQFSIRAEIPPGIPAAAIPVFAFQSGVSTTDDVRWPIVQLLVFQNATAITANSTDTADKIMEHYTSVLNTKLRFGFSATNVRRTFHSTLVAQFDSGVENKIEAIWKIEAILAGKMSRPEMPFKFKRLAFGYGDVVQIPPVSPEFLEKADFFMERRAAEAYSENRYFCSAPTTTEELKQIVEEIERTVS